jgi:hypothetical protein
VSTQQWAFVRFGSSAARSSGRGSLGGFAGVDFGTAREGNAFLDDEFGGFDIADQFGTAFDVEPILGHHIAIDPAADNGAEGGDIALDDGVFPEVQGAVGDQIPLDFPIEGKITRALQVAPDFDVVVKDVFGRISHKSLGFVFFRERFAYARALLADRIGQVKGFMDFVLCR